MNKSSAIINWFPGHMTKALREMEKSIKKVDIVFYCLDARAPFSCLNPKLSLLCRDKKFIYILTKSDFVDEKDINIVKEKLVKNGNIVVSINSLETNSSKIILKKIENVLKEKIEKYTNKGLNTPTIKAMVVGVPNVGKSTLINNLCKKAKTRTGNKAGVTKGEQWVEAGENLVLLDTPGSLWPSFSNEKIANNIALIGSIKDEILDFPNLAYYFLGFIIKKDKYILESRYDIKIEKDDEILTILEKICVKTGSILKGNDFDYERCSKIIIDDFRKNRLGKIFLD